MYSSLHFLIYTGGYRLLGSKEFSKEISYGYSIELFFSLIPLLFCQSFNNTSMIGKPSALQNICVIIKLFSLITFILEIVLMIIEIRLNLKMRKLKVKGFEKPTEEERRRKWSRCAGIMSLVIMILYLIVLILSLSLSKGRLCEGKYSLTLGVCELCKDKNCLDCTGNPSKCSTCAGGYFVDKSG